MKKLHNLPSSLASKFKLQFGGNYCKKKNKQTTFQLQKILICFEDKEKTLKIQNFYKVLKFAIKAKLIF